MLKDIKNGAEIQACTKQPAIGSYIHKKEMVKIHGVMVGWFVGFFFKIQKIQGPKKETTKSVYKCLQMFTISFFWESSSISDCNDLCSKFCNSVGPSKSSVLSY